MQIVQAKADTQEVERLCQSLDHKFEDSFTEVQSQIMRKASADDLALFRKEQSFKVSKNDVQILSNAINERVQEL